MHTVQIHQLLHLAHLSKHIQMNVDTCYKLCLQMQVYSTVHILM